ncbi:MAG: FAD-dependent oxidoreductase [Oligoflexia bacterium]|nr:FAD-dependent oxidoreductase [Oligoflexia bacterium]
MRVVVLGAGVSGHTAASFLRRYLPSKHSVTVISPKSTYNWIPSNIWVGVGKMRREDVVFELAPIYRKAGIDFILGKATALYPEGDLGAGQPYVKVELEDTTQVAVPFDFLVNATGPKLNFGATKGLGPEGFSYSVCTDDHAAHASEALMERIALMKRGARQKFLVGTGHGMCTCQGAAFEYIVNLEFTLRQAGVRDKADIRWISNEFELGDFGMGGLHLKRGGYITHSKLFTESLFAERGLHWITRAHVREVQDGRVYYENLEGDELEEAFDFAMLLPPFTGVGLQAFDRAGGEITQELFAPSGFMKVDADYTAKPFEEWKAADWPKTYQSKRYPRIFATGIAFAPPHGISRPMKNSKGTVITPSPPRTGMPSAIIGKLTARNIAEMIKRGVEEPRYEASMAKMGAACVASAGASLLSGSAASMTVFPIVPDFETYPEYGRDINRTFGEIGLAGHWIKYLLHHLFIYKAKLNPGWPLIPE